MVKYKIGRGTSHGMTGRLVSLVPWRFCLMFYYFPFNTRVVDRQTKTLVNIPHVTRLMSRGYGVCKADVYLVSQLLTSWDDESMYLLS